MASRDEEGGRGFAGPAAQGGLSRLDAFDGVRGICALTIVVGHQLSYWVWTSRGPALAWCALDFLTPVTLFVAASGFTLAFAAPDLSAAASPAAAAARRAFFRRRAARLGPLYYAGLLLALPALLEYKGAFDIAASLFFSLLGVQSLSVVGNEWNGPLWTVSALALCYLCFPRLNDWARGLTGPQALARAAALYGLSVAAVGTCLAAFGLGSGLVVHIFAPLRLPQFACGVLAGAWARRPRPPDGRPWTRVAEACTALFLLHEAALVATVLAVPDLAVWAAWSYAAEFLLLPAACLWLLALSDESCAGLSRRLLASAPLRHLGAVSYALYCLHWPALVLLAWACAGGAGSVPLHHLAPGIHGWYWFPAWALPLTTAACLAVAHAAHRFLELPARRYFSKGAGGPPPAAPASSEETARLVDPGPRG